MCPIQTVPDQLLHAPTASNAPPLSQTVALMWGSDPCFSTPTSPVQIQSYSLSCFLPSFISPTKFCVVLYFLFQWSGTPACLQLMFYKIFYVWRCIPDVSMERDVLPPPTPPPSSLSSSHLLI